ncbi:MAG: hypothetical protein M1816_005787 [Peltula sp. TS41687]|nr:MAG: hypothetical protein M1816_005787 [Peltula sp. TS41687]
MTVKFSDAIKVNPIDDHTYDAHFPEDWCIGSVPHGGYISSVFLSVAAKHFKTTLAHLNQPHTIVLHLEFVRRTRAGPATFKVQHIKIGRKTSTIHVGLWQDDREEVAGYVTNLNMHTESGLTLPTDYRLTPPPPSVDLSRLRDNTDVHWEFQESIRAASFRLAAIKAKFYYPRNRKVPASYADEWVAFADGERFTNESLGYVADSWPQPAETYRPRRLDDGETESAVKEEHASDQSTKWEVFWYPTLVLNLDIKKVLPDEGVEWLFARVSARSIKNGRMDLEVVIMDETGDIVALSHHVAMVLPASRNTAERRKDNPGSKL